MQAKRNHSDPAVQGKRLYLYVRVEVEDCVRAEIEGCVRAFDRNQQVAIHQYNHRHGHHVGNRLNLRKEMVWVGLLSWEQAFLGSERLTRDLHMSSFALRCDLALEALTHQLTSSRRQCSTSSAQSGTKTCFPGRRVLAS